MIQKRAYSQNEWAFCFSVSEVSRTTIHESRTRDTELER